ncbi:hypothetical protein 10S11_58 [uncultured Caudovirales phage]|uniref:Uncharacterized protein n=1 Tax=uncultured Caudovirales phage TaxID=2100421 RepID=A0A2H4J056_9CAUD|nr:hypothetical protein 10S11_58 [uncultured Caudovirales phage]
MKSMPLDKYFEIIRPTYIYLKIIPHKSNKNNNSSTIAKSISTMFKSIKHRIEKVEKKYIYKTNWKCSYMIELNKNEVNDINFYFIVPAHYKNLAIEKIKEVWYRSDIIEVANIKPFSNNAVKYQLNYKKDDALSLKVDKKSNEPLNSILNVFDIMEDGDRVSILHNFGYYGEYMWQNNYKNSINNWKAHKLLEKEKGSGYFVKAVASICIELLQFVLDIFMDLLGGENNKNNNSNLLENAISIINGNKLTLSNGTLKKGKLTVLKTQIVVVAESKDINRATTNALSVCQSYKTLEEDNTLVYKKAKKSFEIEDRTLDGVGENICSIDECHNFLQSPGRDILNKFNIKHTKVIENPLPIELTKGNKHLGRVRYKGEDYEAYLENEYNIGNLPLVLIGSQGGGKTTFMANYAKNCINSDEGLIIIDFIKNCELSNDIKNCIKNKNVIEIDLGNEKTIQGLGFNEIKITEDMSAFNKLKFANIQSQQIMDLIDSISVGDPLSSRMRRFLNSAATIAFVLGYSSIKDVINCLEDYKVRKNYISSLEKELREQLEDEIKTLQELDEWSKKTKDNPEIEIVGTKDTKIEHILDRISMLREDFKLKYMYNKTLDKNIDLVDCMEEGKTILFKMKESDFPTKMSKNVLVTYLISKIWLASQFRGMKSDKPKRCNILIDEVFQAPTAMKKLEYILPQSRKFGCKFIFSTQYIRQLEKIFDTLEASGSSYMLLKGCLEDDFNHFKNKIDEFEFEDLKDMPQYSSMNLIYYSGGYASFISKLPPPIKS